MDEPILLDVEEYQRWFNQALHTIDSARRDQTEKDFAWACFKAQQAGEYAVKALLRGLGLVSVGHSILKLLTELSKNNLEISQPLWDAARELDRHYTPPRYPDAFPAGSPFEFYDRATSKEAIRAATLILDYVRAMKEVLIKDAQGAQE